MSLADKQAAAREAALIAQARAALQARPADPANPAAAAPAVPIECIAPESAAPGSGPAAAERIAAVMAAARAETEHQRRRRRMHYVWLPFAFMAAAGVSTLVWLWTRF